MAKEKKNAANSSEQKSMVNSSSTGARGGERISTSTLMSGGKIDKLWAFSRFVWTIGSRNKFSGTRLANNKEYYGALYARFARRGGGIIQRLDENSPEIKELVQYAQKATPSVSAGKWDNTVIEYVEKLLSIGGGGGRVTDTSIVKNISW
jgi:hypothetical protein